MIIAHETCYMARDGKAYTYRTKAHTDAHKRIVADATKRAAYACTYEIDDATLGGWGGILGCTQTPIATTGDRKDYERALRNAREARRAARGASRI